MKLYIRNKLFMEICGDDTLKSITINLLYGMKYFFMDFRTVMKGAREKLREREVCV